MISVRSMLRNFIVLVLFATLAGAPLQAGDSSLPDGVRLYDSGRYAEALPLLQQVVAAGNADGITHYRLYFCQRATGAPEQRQTLEIARTLLEQELEAADGFEVAFYLANTYTNLGQADQVARISSEMTARFESGGLTAPVAAVEQFRLGKLYADQARESEATPWLTRAVDGFAATPEARNHAYLEWAARWLAERAMAGERFEVAAKHYAHVRDVGNPSLKDLDNLALSSLIIGNYAQAATAWKAAARMNPTQADRFRYGAGLASLASKVEDIPISPDGDRSWEETTREELEELLRKQSGLVREVRAEIETAGSPDAGQRKAFAARIAAARPLFVAAAVEYTRRGYSLREAAFFGGYAPLIFKAREWEVTAPPPRRWSPRELAAERERLMREKAKTEKD